MARGFQGAVLRGFGARDHSATVLETIRIAPHFVRIRMESPTLFQDAAAEPAAWLRFWFPDPEGSSTEFQRAYTISEADVPAGRFAVDVVLHDPAGPASLWARTVEPGATIAVMSLMGSSRFDTPDEQPAGYLLIGDSASIPGINGIIGSVPDDVPIEVYLEQHDDNDRLIPLAEHPRLRVHWTVRRDEKSLAASIENRDWSELVCLGDTRSHHAQARSDPAARRLRLSQVGNPRAGLLERRPRNGHPAWGRAGRRRHRSLLSKTGSRGSRKALWCNSS